MDNLIIVNEKGFTDISPEANEIKVFKNIKTKHRKDFRKILAYIYFRYSLKSPFRATYSEDEIDFAVRKAIDYDGKITMTIQNAIDFYVNIQKTKTLQLLEAAEQAANQIIAYLKSFNINEVNPDKKDDSIGKLVKNLKSIDEVVLSLQNTRKKVEMDLSLKDNKIRGKGKIRKREVPK